MPVIAKTSYITATTAFRLVVEAAARNPLTPDTTKPRMAGLPCRFGLAANSGPRKSQAIDLQRVAVGFERANTLLELNDIRRRCEVSLTAATFSSFKPVAQLFDQKRNHDELQGSVKNPRWVGHQGFPVKGLTRIIAIRCNLASELPE
jgi:hypothetical protein